MTAPRLEIDLGKIEDNARILVDRLAVHGISVTGVTKATLGCPEVAAALLRSGVRSLGDSRIENIQAMRRANVPATMNLLRAPMLSQVQDVVANADISFNTERETLLGLSRAAQEMARTHGVLLMIELGDLREGIMPADLEESVREVLRLPNLELMGIGTNLACRSGASPSPENMAELSSLADSIEATFGLVLGIVSGGNSANLPWALGGAETGRINDLRLGESVLLGCEPLHRRPLEGLHTDAITLVAEVIESKRKPAQPWGELAQAAFLNEHAPGKEGVISQSIFALGHQDTDPAGLAPPNGIEILGASSDHLIVSSESGDLAVGDELSFQLNYSALVRAMTSPFVAKVHKLAKATSPS